MDEKPFIVLTGFGPFGEHKVNASSEAVKTIQDQQMWNDDRIDLHFEILPVVYDFVQSEVPQRWTRGSKKPLALIHVGVSHLAHKLTLEQIGRNCGHERGDVLGHTPKEGRCVDCGDNELRTNFDLKKLVDLVNNSPSSDGVKAEVSDDAGRYLCNFIFYKSLHETQGNALFIHVPCLGAPYHKGQLAKAICLVLRGIIDLHFPSLP